MKSFRSPVKNNKKIYLSVIRTLALTLALILGLMPATILFDKQLNAVVPNAIPTVKADSAFFALTIGNPFSQNWTTTTLITANDNWGGVPSIQGFLGDDGSTTASGTDPQTITASFATQDVIANQSNPNTNATGGVAEFDGIADPTIALQGSGTADYPHIVIYLDASGCASPNRVRVAYDARDIDGSTDNTNQQVALQFRTGGAVAYTNVAAGYIADATTGPSLATLVTPVSALLPLAASGQAQLEVRVITSNAPSNDEWVGIDNINIQCAPPSAAETTISGRILTGRGRPIVNAVVTLLSENGGEPRHALTNPFGYYRFLNVPVGTNYFLTVRAKNRVFAQETIFVDTNGDTSNVNFISTE